MRVEQENRIAELENEIKQNEEFGKIIEEYAKTRIMNLNISIDEITLHNGVKYLEDCYKRNALLCRNHSEEERNDHVQNIEKVFHVLEELLKQDLQFHGLLVKYNS